MADNKVKKELIPEDAAARAAASAISAGVKMYKTEVDVTKHLLALMMDNKDKKELADAAVHAVASAAIAGVKMYSNEIDAITHPVRTIENLPYTIPYSIQYANAELTEIFGVTSTNDNALKTCKANTTNWSIDMLNVPSCQAVKDVVAQRKK